MLGGQYTVVETLGRGSSGVTYKVYSMQHTVVLAKCLVGTLQQLACLPFVVIAM